MRSPTRRHFLRGAGVALALPMFESLAPRRARGAPPAPLPLRFVSLYFPMGTAPFWRPAAADANGVWQLSPILEPLTRFQDRVTVLSGVANTAYAGVDPAPGFAHETGSFLTCARAQGTPLVNGKSIDQVVADGLNANGTGSRPPINSLQLGAATTPSPAADAPPSFATSISWRDAASPLGKIVNPQVVFDQLISGRPFVPPNDPATLARKATQKSVLDYVLEDAAAKQKLLGKSDRRRLDQFQASVRDLEKRVLVPPPPMGCDPLLRPTQAIDVGNVPPGYARNTHLQLMIDLMVMALSCGSTRVVSLMLDDAGSDFVYDFLPLRTFSAAGSTLGTPHLASSCRDLATGSGPGASDGYATINRWFVAVLAYLVDRLQLTRDYREDGNYTFAMDQTVISFGSGMHDARTRSPADLPLLLVSGASTGLKRGKHLDLQGTRSLSDVYLTLSRDVFGLTGVQTFADSQGGAPEILA